MAQKQNQGSLYKGKVEIIDFTPEDKRPEMAVFAVDRGFKVLEKSDVDAEGRFRLSPKSVDTAHQILIGPRVDDPRTIDRENLIPYRSTRFKAVLEGNGIFEIPKKHWYPWLKIKRCVHGSVSHCFPYPFFIAELLERAQVFQEPPLRTIAAEVIAKTDTSIGDARIARPLTSFLHYRCDNVCDGLVEVYRRTCCCHPWIVFDPRLDRLIHDLEHLIYEIPEIKWPPGPDPDPPPLEELRFLKSGALDKGLLNLRKDLHALKTLPQAELVDYVNARRYLFCICGPASKVAQGFIQPNGEFHICWWEWPSLMVINCHEEYAYVVKQNIDGSTVTIYDGVAANQWFHAGDDAELVSYHPQAQGCRHNEFPGEGAFVLLQDIGLTPSYRLKTPDASGWDRVNIPVYNDGLAFPAASPAAAKGKYLNRNWGGTLLLRYHFSEAMKGIGAKYYRVSVVAADGSGNPTGTRSPLAPREWRYYEAIGTDIFVRAVALGPHSAGSQNSLYEIPFDDDQEWQSGQYHAILDTRQFSNGRYLLTVEVFNSSGVLLRPTGTPDPGGSMEAGYTYRRWFQVTGPTAEVPFAALTHMLWWDNRKAKAKIVDLRVNGDSNTEECQFLVASGKSMFSVGYRAYHDNPMFLLDHRLWWRRGLGGPSGILTSPHPNPDNVGVPPNLPHESGSDTFADMLNGHTKCSFTVNLHSNVKTFNGIGTLNGLDAWDQAAFALEIGP